MAVIKEKDDNACIVYPGKLRIDNGASHISHNGLEWTFFSKQNEVLKKSKYNAFEWKTYTVGKEIPENAFVVGIMGNTPLYSYRAIMEDGQKHCGYVRDKKASIPYGYRERTDVQVKSGEILVDGELILYSNEFIEMMHSKRNNYIMQTLFRDRSLFMPG